MYKDEKDEDEKMYSEIRKKFEKMIDDIMSKKYGYDLAFFDFVLMVEELDENFNKVNERIIYDARERHWCEFCGKETKHYDRQTGFYLCAKCYAKLKRKE